MIHVGDCQEVMKTLDAESIDAIVTDPPYGLSFMGKDWDHGIPGEAFWREALRVAKPGTHLLAFGGTRTFHRLTVAIEDAGWEIRDCIMWVYGSGFPKSHNLSGEWQGYGTALKPAWEPIIVARKPLAGTVARNVQEYGTGAVNVDACRIEGYNGWTAKKSPTGTFSQEHRPWKDRLTGNEVVGGGFNGRWPANLIHDGSDEVMGLFPQSSVTGKRTQKSKSQQVINTTWGTDNHESREYTDSGSAARFFYCSKASKADRDSGLDGWDLQQGGSLNMRTDSHSQANGMNTGPRANYHPTVKPNDLMRYLCRLVTPPGGTVLDPFCGSGSTGKAAVMEGFRFIGIELNPEYAAIAEARIRAEMEKMPLLEAIH